jgi:limonene 1,2-monooxygenase
MFDCMRFGIFLAPFHAPGVNPILSRQRDMELDQWLDALG